MRDEGKPKFNPEYDFLEIPEIFSLQILIDSIVSSSEKENLGRGALDQLNKQMEPVIDRFAAEAKENDAHLRAFIKFMGHNLHILSVGGMDIGRSRIGIFLERKYNELRKRFGRLVDEV